MDLDNFKIENDTSLKVDFQRLFNAIDLNTLQFTVNRKHEDCMLSPIHIDGVTMSGKPDRVRQSLKEIRESVFKKIIEYANSDESIDTKIEMFGAIEIALAEKMFHWEILFPELYEGPMYFDLIDNENKIRTMTILELQIPEVLKAEIIQHHNVRQAFLILLRRQIGIQLLKLKHLPISQTSKPQTTELELAEIWLGLDKQGYFSELNQNEKAQKRKAFYQVFGVADKNYNDKRNQINQRQIPKFLFIESMLETLKSEYEK